VLGQLNRPPAFITQPNTEAIPGLPYAYPAAATDPDGDPLHFTLLTGPAGMQAGALTGKVTWSPQQADLGTHGVALRVDDGRGGLQVGDGQGGTATQTYAVGVAPEAGNHPPAIVSTPPTQFPVEVPGTPTGIVTPGLLSLATGEQQTDHVTVQVPAALVPAAI